MELEHRFEVPVGLDEAWTHLLDMEQVAACFPGATLTSADGEEYTGKVKVKLGPIQLTYAGSARIVEADETAHRAVIEASGTAARSGSTASMTVTATATEVTADRTAVVMATSLTITGKPAQFGRGVMAEVGNKILGSFADCIAATVTGDGAADAAADAAARDGARKPDDDGPGDTAAEAAGVRTAPSGAGDGADVSAGPAPTYTRSPEPIDLLASARGSIIKRLVPVAAGLVVLCGAWWWWRRCRR